MVDKVMARINLREPRRERLTVPAVRGDCRVRTACRTWAGVAHRREPADDAPCGRSGRAEAGAIGPSRDHLLGRQGCGAPGRDLVPPGRGAPRRGARAGDRRGWENAVVVADRTRRKATWSCFASAVRDSSRRSFPACSRCLMSRVTGLESGHRSWTGRSTAGLARASRSHRQTSIATCSKASRARRSACDPRSRPGGGGWADPRDHRPAAQRRRDLAAGPRHAHRIRCSGPRREDRDPASLQVHGWSTATRPSTVVTRSTGRFTESSWAG